jgi:hypothetical protein
MPVYWFDVFTRATWQEAVQNGLRTSGFGEHKRPIVQQV